MQEQSLQLGRFVLNGCLAPIVEIRAAAHEKYKGDLPAWNREAATSMACSDPWREKQHLCTCTWLVCRTPFAMMQRCSISSLPSFPEGLGALDGRAGWSCLGNMEVVSSRFSEVPDFGPMLVSVSLVVNLPSTAEREEAGWVKDPRLAQQVMGVLPRGTY